MLKRQKYAHLKLGKKSVKLSDLQLGAVAYQQTVLLSYQELRLAKYFKTRCWFVDFAQLAGTAYPAYLAISGLYGKITRGKDSFGAGNHRHVKVKGNNRDEGRYL
ncbi:hypothetical protein EVAR_91299_1 [Eumeta japonica]|uniref:Uncharacterized protein n=1 Tax=Eumeta variegata TaxID=151549 RepID=A0A4C1SUQ1_EUMVA|nr:hypothetical protein EVAR_91299_1 [Eumeta japonica]